MRHIPSLLLGLIFFLIASLIFLSNRKSTSDITNDVVIHESLLAGGSDIPQVSSPILFKENKENKENKEIPRSSPVAVETPELTESVITPQIIDKEKALELVTSLHSKVLVTLSWIVSLNNNNKKLLAWNTVSNSDIHIVHKLARYLKYYIDKITHHIDKNDHSVDNVALDELRNLMTNGYQCGVKDQSYQEIISTKIQMDICSEIEWYKVVQLTWPEARVFIDVGANKGYLGSLFVGLWGGGGLGLSPLKLFTYSTDKGTWKKSRNPAGYCRDGYNDAIALYCPGDKRDAATGQCLETLHDIKVASVDGSSYLTQVMNNIIQNAFPKVHDGKYWTYYNYAMSDVPAGKAYFTRQTNDTVGYEGGHISNKGSGDLEEVDMTTVDYLASQVLGLDRIDVLKIDAEGNDNKVIYGASKYIRSSVGLLTFECGKGTQFSYAMIVEMDSIGFSCYSTSRAGLFKLNGQCMSKSFIDKKWDKGNVFCASRVRAPLVTLALDALSFPIMIQQSINFTTSSSPMTADEFHKAFVNVKPFCQPFPSCILNI